MDKILIILREESIALYDINDGAAKVHMINGESETDIDEYEEIARSLKGMYEELSDIDVDLLYCNNNTEIIKGLTEDILPCGSWKVFSAEMILPETAKADETNISNDEIADLYAERINNFYEIMSGQKKIAEEQAKEEEYLKKIKELEDELDNEKHLRITQKKDSDEKIKQLENASSVDLKAYKKLRRKVYSSVDGNVIWDVESGEKVYKDAIIGHNETSRIYAPTGGMFFKVIPKTRGNLNFGELVGIIADENENMGNFNEYIEKLKNEPIDIQCVYAGKSDMDRAISGAKPTGSYVRKGELIAAILPSTCNLSIFSSRLINCVYVPEEYLEKTKKVFAQYDGYLFFVALTNSSILKPYNNEFYKLGEEKLAMIVLPEDMYQSELYSLLSGVDSAKIVKKTEKKNIGNIDLLINNTANLRNNI